MRRSAARMSSGSAVQKQQDVQVWQRVQTGSVPGRSACGASGQGLEPAGCRTDRLIRR